MQQETSGQLLEATTVGLAPADAADHPGHNADARAGLPLTLPSPGSSCDATGQAPQKACSGTALLAPSALVQLSLSNYATVFTNSQAGMDGVDKEHVKRVVGGL